MLLKIFAFFSCCLLSFSFYLPTQAQGGLIINEISNGRFSNREFVELLVIKDCGVADTQFLDIRGWLIDDNNGDFACDAIQDVGIRTGHVRFDSSGNWDSIPYGAIILIYNNSSKNSEITMPDDPTDANGDLLYVVPANFGGIEYTAGAPRGDGACGAPGPLADPTYNSPTAYFNGNPWGSRIQLRDLGDASQTRRPDGSYFHGISYGIGDITGGPDGLLVGTGTGTRKDYYFNGSDFRNVSNYDSVPNVFNTPSLQTPGAANNALNQNFIDSIQAINCGILPVLISQFSATLRNEEVEVNWTSALELNSLEYVVERAGHGQVNFEPIGNISAAGHSAGDLNYDFIDHDPVPGTSYYRLRAVDLDGAFSYSGVRAVEYIGEHIVFNMLYPNPVTDRAHFELACETELRVQIYDLTGRMVMEQAFAAEEGFRTLEMDLLDLDQGLYIYLLRSKTGASVTGRLIKE